VARQLQALVAVLGLDPGAFRLREGQAVGVLPSSDAAAVTWDSIAPAYRVGDAAGRGAWSGLAGDRWTACARLRRSAAGYATDAAHGGLRTVRTPTLRAAGVRAWLGVELGLAAPPGSAVLFRIADVDTGDELYWTGLEWVAGASGPPDPAAWNTATELQRAFPRLPGNLRALAVVAWLRTNSRTVTPAFYGARVAYGVRQVSPLDDALFRTFLSSLRAELSATGVAEWTTTAATTSVDLGGQGRGPAPFAYQVIGVDAVFDLTEDPDELAPLAGTFTDGQWIPATAIPAGQVIRIEFRFVPDLVVRRHQDLEDLAALPAVYIAPSGAPTATLRAQGAFLVRDQYATPPTAWELPDPEIVTVPLDVRIVAELVADVERVGQALTRWIARGATGAPGLGVARELLSPETGQIVQVRSVSRAVESAASLAQGVAESREALLLTFARATAQTVSTATLIGDAAASFATLPLET
jgi:hypothetical protein